MFLSEIRFLCLVLYVIPCFIKCQGKEKIVVSCVGDSITKGAGAKEYPEHSYPAILEDLLNANNKNTNIKYKAHNFG